MKKIAKLLLIPATILSLTSASFAQDFRMGDETKGLKVKISDDTDIGLRIRLQPRLDVGDLVKEDATPATKYESGSDLYIRRIRLEFDGNLAKNLKYNLHIDADRTGQASTSSATLPTNKPAIYTVYMDYQFADSFGIRFGNAKLPYSRVELTSSSRQLLVERPVSAEAAVKLFDSYRQTHILLYGKAMEGMFVYNLAAGGGWEPNSPIYSTTNVHKSGLLTIARVEVSPPGWIEEKKSDAHLGKGQHLTIGANYAAQNGIEYIGTGEEDRTLTGIDVSGHWEGITGQFEYNTWKVESTVAANSKEPKGWYLQAGYFVPGINLEPVARYEVYDQDSNSSNKQEKTTTIGVNWYLKGHSMKIGLNRVSTKYDSSASGTGVIADATKDTYQLQAQLYF